MSWQKAVKPVDGVWVRPFIKGYISSLSKYLVRRIFDTYLGIYFLILDADIVGLGGKYYLSKFVKWNAYFKKYL